MAQLKHRFPRRIEYRVQKSLNVMFPHKDTESQEVNKLTNRLIIGQLSHMMKIKNYHIPKILDLMSPCTLDHKIFSDIQIRFLKINYKYSPQHRKIQNFTCNFPILVLCTLPDWYCIRRRKNKKKQKTKWLKTPANQKQQPKRWIFDGSPLTQSTDASLVTSRFVMRANKTGYKPHIWLVPQGSIQL